MEATKSIGFSVAIFRPVCIGIFQNDSRALGIALGGRESSEENICRESFHAYQRRNLSGFLSPMKKYNKATNAVFS